MPVLPLYCANIVEFLMKKEKETTWMPFFSEIVPSMINFCLILCYIKYFVPPLEKNSESASGGRGEVRVRSKTL